MYSNLINAEILIFVYHISGIERIPPFPLRSMILRDSRSLGLLDFVVPMCIASRSTKTICYCFLYTPLGAIFYPSLVLWRTIVHRRFHIIKSFNRTLKRFLLNPIFKEIGSILSYITLNLCYFYRENQKNQNSN